MRLEVIMLYTILVTFSYVVLYYYHVIYDYMSHIYQGVAIDKVFKSSIFSYFLIIYLIFILFFMPFILIFKGLKLIHISLTVIIALIIVGILGIFVSKITQNYIRHRHKLFIFYNSDRKNKSLNTKEINQIENTKDYLFYISLLVISVTYFVFLYVLKIDYNNLINLLYLIGINSLIFLQILKLYQLKIDKHFINLNKLLDLTEDEIKQSDETKINMNDIKW